MSADPIVYCLERVTDYAQFERLATDLMAGTDYPGIEPLGGTSDGGCDALHVDKSNGTVTVFAYSVRADWEVKLRADCKRIADGKSRAECIVFVSSRPIPTGKRKRIREEVSRSYGWQVEFYDVERIRALLTGPLSSLVLRHPSIFVAPWFEHCGGELVSREKRDLIVIDHVLENYAFSAWLFGRLSAAGYSVWCRGLAPLVGENAHASISAISHQRAACYLPVLSLTSVVDPDLRSRIAIVGTNDLRTVPCWLDDLTECAFDSQLRALVPARFDLGWSGGLAALIQQFEDSRVVRPLEQETGKMIALEAYQPEPLVSQKSERVFANVFPVKVPTTVLVHELNPAESELDPLLSQRWAHVRRNNYLLSFASPPKDVPLSRLLAYDWRSISERFSVKSVDLVKMLVKRSLFVACHEVGFKWCNERFTFFLNEIQQKRHRYQDIDRRLTNVSFTGERSFGSGDQKSTFKYQLGPVFRISVDENNIVSVSVAIYVRVTDREGNPLHVRMIPSRRKRVTKSWWNRQWLQRILGVMQLLAGVVNIEGHITVGERTEAVMIDVEPLSWDCPVSIDVQALDRVGDFQEELAAVHEREEEEEEQVAMEELDERTV